MSTAFPKTVVIDIGRTWTKAFSLANDKNSLTIEKKLSLPTTIGDLSIATNLLLKSLKATKETPLIFTGALPEAEVLAKNYGATYADQIESKDLFCKYIDKVGFRKALVLDTGDYSYAQNLKINQIGAFLTSERGETDIENYFGNKSIKSQAIPTNATELEIEAAFYRVAFAHNNDFAKASNVVNLIISGGFFSYSPKASKLALILLDILASGRVAQVKLDRYQFLHGFGALLKKFPQVADWENNFWQDMGGFISFGGRGKITLDYGYTENQELEIVEDEIALVPSSANQKIAVTLHSSAKEKQIYNLNGGLFGILLDGRIKPLKLAFGRAESREAMKRWSAAIDKVEVIA